MSVSFEQDTKENHSAILIRNRNSAPLYGVLIQVELLDGSGDLVSAFRAMGTIGHPPRLGIYDQVVPLINSGDEAIGGVRWRKPLEHGEERRVSLDSYLILPQCPDSARLSVFGIQDSNLNWQRVSKAILRQTALPTRFRPWQKRNIQEINQLWHKLSPLGEVAAHVRIDETGALQLIATSPLLSPEERKPLEAFLEPRRFSPSIEQSGARSEEIIILLRFSKELYNSAIPDLPSRFTRYPLWVLGVGPDDFFSRSY